VRNWVHAVDFEWYYVAVNGNIIHDNSLSTCSWRQNVGLKLTYNEIQESRAIAGRTARCRCKVRYVSNFTTASCGFSATTRLSNSTRVRSVKRGICVPLLQFARYCCRVETLSLKYIRAVTLTLRLSDVIGQVTTLK